MDAGIRKWKPIDKKTKIVTFWVYEKLSHYLGYTYTVYT